MRSTKLISKCQSGQGIRNRQENAFSTVFNKGAKAISKVLTPVDKFLSNLRPTMFIHSNGSGYPGFGMGYHKPVIVEDSPAREAAALSAIGHIASQTVEQTPLFPIGNAVDIVTSAPDAFMDMIHWGAEQSPESFRSVVVDLPEVFPGGVDDVIAWEGFADDLKQTTNGKVDITLYDKAKKLVPKTNK